MTALLISSVIVYDLSENLFASHQARTFSLQLDNIVTTLSSVTNVSKKAYESYADNQRKNLELSRELLKSLINAEGYEGPLVFEDGFVVSCKDGQIIYPQSETAFPKIDVSMLERPGEVFETALAEKDYTIDVQGD